MPEYTVVLRFPNDEYEDNDTYTESVDCDTIDDAVRSVAYLAQANGRTGQFDVEAIIKGRPEYLSADTLASGHIHDQSDMPDASDPTDLVSFED